MEPSQNYFEPHFIDNEYMSKADHQLAMGYVADDFEQLIAELYDSCESIDRDIVHDLICDISDKLYMIDIPNIKTLKIKK